MWRQCCSRGSARRGTLQSGSTSSVNTPGDFGIALVGFVFLTVWRTPPLLVVAISALGGIALALRKV